MSRTTRRAFTLVEMLIVVGIIAVLFSILSPVFISARKKALQASDISNLRQIGAAGALYMSDTGVHPLGTRPLVETGLLAEELCASPNDRYRMGFANALVLHLATQSTSYIGLESRHRNSYPALFEYRIHQDRLEKQIEPAPGAGWLVSLDGTVPDTSPGQEDRFLMGAFTGTYHRLMLDGSVAQRRHFRIRNAAGEPVWGPIFLFIDGEEWIRKAVVI